MARSFDLRFAVLGFTQLREARRGVALFVFDAVDATRALTAVYSLRKQYDGGIAVLMWGKEVPALRIACARLGVEYVPIIDSAKAREDALLQGSVSGEPAAFAREQARLLAMGYSPFVQTVMVGTDSAMPQLAKWWRALGRVGVPPAGSGILPEPSERTTGTRARKGSLLDSTGCYAGRPPYPAHVVMDDGATPLVLTARMHHSSAGTRGGANH